MHGYSRKQLSELLNITEQAIWQYENEYTSPKLQIVNTLSNVFNVKSKYFYSPDVITKSKSNIPIVKIKIENIAYRAKIINTVSKTQSEAKHIEYLDNFVNSITNNVKVPSYTIVQLRNLAIDYLNKTNDDRITQIKYVANLARQKLNLEQETNDKLIYFIEKSGIFVFEKAIGDEIDAYSLWTEDDRAYIMLGNLKKSAVRRNFDIAHELGHLLLHYKIEFISLDRKQHKTIENEADLFASMFLLPESELLNELISIKNKTNPDSYLDLKRKWNVSLQVLGYRTTQLGLINSKDHRNFYASLHRKHYLEKEPLDNYIPIQKPLKIKTIINFLETKNIIDVNKLLEEEWKVDLQFFEKLTGIDSEFVAQFNKHSNDFSISSIDKYKKNLQE
jgi:Zn-dependent peptidase ImmA (M78 family)/transcriptional regulator with XRE-family HTH domain